MQRQWTIECRADFEDNEKIELVTEIVRRHAAHMLTELQLIKDKQKPEIACYSEDFFHGTQDIELIGATGQVSAVAPQDEEDVSDELLAAVREMKK